MNESTPVKIQTEKISYLDSYFFFFKLHSTQAESESERKRLYSARYRRSDGWVWIKTGFLDPEQEYDTKSKSSSLSLYTLKNKE